jgi:hypothetical protein
VARNTVAKTTEGDGRGTFARWLSGLTGSLAGGASGRGRSSARDAGEDEDLDEDDQDDEDSRGPATAAHLQEIKGLLLIAVSLWVLERRVRPVEIVA